MIQSLIRILRKKIILALIFSLSLCYCLYSFTGEQLVQNHSSVRKLDIEKVAPVTKSFVWNSAKTSRNNSFVPTACRNSIQGKFFIADDEGCLCRRMDLLWNGCCNSNSTFTKLFVCDSCHEDGCCTIYEHCVSCCMNPDKVPILEQILAKSHPSLKLFMLSPVRDQFELCSVRCRTNSRSVKHENSYQNPYRKYCYGEPSVPEKDKT